MFVGHHFSITIRWTAIWKRWIGENGHSTRQTWAWIIKLITAVIYGFRNKLVFVIGKLFQPSLNNTLAQYENP